MNRSKVALAAVLSLLSLTALSTLALRGHFAPTGQFQAIEIPSNQLSTIYSFSRDARISLPTSNFTILHNEHFQNTTVANNTFFGSFASESKVSVVFHETIDVDPVKYPYFEVSVTSAPNFSSDSGFGFGLRFLVRLEGGSLIQVMNEPSAVEHVLSGGTTTLRVYVPNYTSGITDILGIRFYAEERAGITSDYWIRVNSIIASSLNKVPYCSSPECFIPLELPESTGYFDTLVVDTVFSGRSSYKIGFSYLDQTFVSRAYSNGSSHVSVTSRSEDKFEDMALDAIPFPRTTLHVLSGSVPTSINLKNLKLTFTPVPANVVGEPVPWQTDQVLLFAEMMILFALPAQFLLHRFRWRIAMVGGVIVRLAIMPWTGHKVDTIGFIRTAYLYYHNGWAPTFYNPPTHFALSVPIGSMQFYYLLGLDRIDSDFLFHYGGVLGTFFVKFPFLLVDVTNALIISRVSRNRTYGLFYFLNPFSIFVSAAWGQYEALTTLALIAGYVASIRLKPRLASLVSFGGFLLSGLVELFGFLVVPMLAVYLTMKKRFVELVLPVSATVLALLVPSSLNQFVFSVRVSSPIIQPNIYSLSGSFGVNSILPFIAGLTVSGFLAFYSLIRASTFLSTVAPFSAMIISFGLFSGNHPQLMLIVLGLMTLLFAVRDDVEGLIFVWVLGAILTFITIVGVQSFAYLLTGEGYFMIPLIEGGNHLKFFAVGLLIVDVGLLARAYRRLPLWPTSVLIVALIGLGWFLVNFV